MLSAIIKMATIALRKFCAAAIKSTSLSPGTAGCIKFQANSLGFSVLNRQWISNNTRAICIPKTEQIMPASSQGIMITERAAKRLHEIAEPGHILRVLVEGGGCSGFQFEFKIDNEVNDEDRVYEKDGAQILVDLDSLQYIKGSTVDYTQELIRSAFTLVNNPQSEGGCSCGASFSIKL